MAEVVSVVKEKTAEHAARLDMHADRITDVEQSLGECHVCVAENNERIADLEESLGGHLARMATVSDLSSKALSRAEAVRLEAREQTEHLDELTEIVSVLIEAVHKLMRLSDEMDADFNGRLSFLEVISE